MKLILSLFVCLILGTMSGCATSPTAEELAVADYGDPITESEARAAAQDAILAILKDPESASFEWGTFEQGYVRNGALRGGGFLYGYRLEVHVNARNSFGGYVGRRLYQFLFHDGEIAAAWGETPLSGGSTYMQRLR